MTLIDDDIAFRVLSALVDHDSRSVIDVVFAQPAELVAAIGRELDDALLDARRRGLIVGERGEGDGSVGWWSTVRLTPAGLRTLGQWPPTGREWSPGAWDQGHWGQRARPLLHRLLHEPPAHDYYPREGIGCEDHEPQLEWTALLSLMDAGLVSGAPTTEGVATLRVTTAGRQALDRTPRHPLDVAEAQLRSGAPVDATVTAVEGALLPHLRELARSRGLHVTHPDGHPVKVAKLNDSLRTDGAYCEADRAQVEAWAKLRNQLAHHASDPVSDARIANIIAGIRVFLDEHPVS
jgi:hypothetical protein